MPQAANTETELSQPISLDDFYPEDKDYYNFEGSLTTPPCTEVLTGLSSRIKKPLVRNKWRNSLKPLDLK